MVCTLMQCVSLRTENVEIVHPIVLSHLFSLARWGQMADNISWQGSEILFSWKIMIMIINFITQVSAASFDTLIMWVKALFIIFTFKKWKVLNIIWTILFMQLVSESSKYFRKNKIFCNLNIKLHQFKKFFLKGQNELLWY